MTAGLSSPEPEDSGAVARDAAFLPDGVTPGATNLPHSGQSVNRSGNDGSGDLRAGASWAAVEALAALLEPEAFDPDQPADETWRRVTQQRALGHAAKVITSDYRRVVEDDDTIERLAAILAKADGWFPWDQPADVEQDVAVVDDVKDGFRSMARAVVRALREETAWVPGDPVHPRETGLNRCDGCGTQWTDGPAACPECGKVPNG